MDMMLEHIPEAEVSTTRQQRIADIRQRIQEPNGIAGLRRVLAELCDLMVEESAR